jgi:hypothetical protein
VSSTCLVFRKYKAAYTAHELAYFFRPGVQGNQQYRQCKYNVALRRARVTTVAVEKHEFVSLVSVIQHATRMRHIIFTSVTCLAIPYFSTLSHKRHDFRKEKILNIKCVFTFYTTFIGNISHSKLNSARYCHKCTLVFT